MSPDQQPPTRMVVLGIWQLKKIPQNFINSLLNQEIATQQMLELYKTHNYRPGVALLWKEMKIEKTAKSDSGFG